jgi:2-C-methyl-D-erythritol 4-phosphate cytidylyltransferase
MVESLGNSVATFEGSSRNVKITTAEDLMLAEAYLH